MLSTPAQIGIPGGPELLVVFLLVFPLLAVIAAVAAVVVFFFRRRRSDDERIEELEREVAQLRDGPETRDGDGEPDD